MDLYVQVGARMMQMSCELFAEWGGGAAILSPRDLTPDQLRRLSADLRELRGEVLLDPQFYIPRADYQRLISHDYWPDDYDTAEFTDASRQIMLRSLAELNRNLGTTHLIVPGERADIVDDFWLESQRGFVEAARQTTDQPLIATICLSAESVRANEQINLVVEQAEQMPVSGFYLVIESPKETYLTEDPLWLANALDLAAALTRLHSNVIVGYCNQQQLIMGCAGVRAIASGAWNNVRSFRQAKFRADYASQFVPRSTGPVWYFYCPQALSEYSLQFLDLAFSVGLRSSLSPDPPTPYSTALFAVQQPSSSGWSQADSFKHYLVALRSQAQSIASNSFDETVANYRALLDTAEDIIRRLRERGITGRDRDFGNVLDTNRAALITLENTQGPVVRRSWSNFPAAG